MWGETTRVENRGETTRGETTRGETSWGRNVLLPVLVGFGPFRSVPVSRDTVYNGVVRLTKTGC